MIKIKEMHTSLRVLNHGHHWQNSLFWAIPFLEVSRFQFFKFAKILFFTEQGSALRPTPNLEDQVPVFIFPSVGMALLYPQAQSSLSVAFYGSQGYGGSILTCLHMEMCVKYVYITVILILYV
jgi:hypothetical protein